MTNDEGRGTSAPEGGLAGKGWWEVRVAWVVGGSGGGSGRCEPHGQRMGGVGAVRAVGAVGGVGAVARVRTRARVGMLDIVKVLGL